MTEQELREKIVAVLKKGQETFSADFHAMMTAAFEGGAKHFGSKDIKKSIYEYYADALIAAGITFDSEWKHRAKVAESKLFDLAMLCVKSDQNFYNKDEQLQKQEAKQMVKIWLNEEKQAEKELEEGKDD